MANVLLSRWIPGEAAERGISVSNTEVSNQLQQLQKQQFGGKKQFQRYIKQAGYTPRQAREQVELSMIADQIQRDLVPQTPTISESEISNYYEANKAQFSQPETRDVRQILNKDKAKVEQAKAQLEQDDSAKSWDKVAAKYSTDKATKTNGGLRQGVAQGQGDPAVDKQIFAAAQGQLVGPFKAQNGYYLIEVEKVTPASTTPLDKVSSQIKQQLGQGLQQEILTNFQNKFVDKWTGRTFCATGYVTDRCANFTPQDACNGDDSGESGNLDKAGCDAFVPSEAPVAPGRATVFPGQPAQGIAQGPIQAGGTTTSAPPGVIGPSGAPPLPPGAAPQTAPPSG
jgi:parvulin-like peptidyl-prolyl isomerase